jgi:DNA-directed RNA polymerase specialized sigma24 family protein
MFRSNEPKIADFRAEDATPVDFCDLFRDAAKHLYLLAFLLTANHAESEQCFVSTVEKAFKEQAVFKESVRSWVKRTLIENTIKIVSPASARNGQRRELWSAGQRERQRECQIDSVTKLPAIERFVFVMSILERHSDWDCALLLGCSMNQVAQALMKALRRLPDLAALVSRDLAICKEKLAMETSNIVDKVDLRCL